MIEPKIKPMFPHAQMLAYRKDIKKFIRKTQRKLDRALNLRHDNQDNQDWRDEWRRVLMNLPKQLELDFSELEETAQKHAGIINEFALKQFNKIIQSAYGQTLNLLSAWLPSSLKNWVAENVRLIRNLTNHQLNKIQEHINHSALNNTSRTDLIKKIQSVKKMALSRAELIADDQVGKLNAHLMQKRQQEIGVKQYRWRGTLDERERDSHVRREGKIFNWNDPPSDGHAGQAIRCRCWASMILPELQDLDKALFGDGDNRLSAQQMTARGLNPTNPPNPFERYQYVPVGTLNLPNYIRQVPNNTPDFNQAMNTTRLIVAYKLNHEEAAALQDFQKSGLSIADFIHHATNPNAFVRVVQKIPPHELNKH